MKYNIERTYNIGARIRNWPLYEMLRLGIVEAESKEQAEKELEQWVESLMGSMKAKMEQKKEDITYEPDRQ